MKRLLLPLLIFPISVFAAGGLPDKPYIYVRGEAEIEKSADMAMLRFDVVARAPEESKASDEAQSKANKIFALLKERKIADNDVIAESLRSEPQFENEENYQRRGKVIGYVVTRPFEVKVRDIATFSKLADEVMAIGGIEFSSIGGDLQKEKEIREELWGKALANARDQAEKTTKQSGMKIDSLFAISPVPIPQIVSAMFPQEATAERTVVTGSNPSTAKEQVPSQYRLRPIKLSESVHVIYLISPAK